MVGKLKERMIKHRKMWEFFFVYRTLTKLGAVGPGKSGLTFGVGKEPLPSAFADLGAKVLATDMPPDLQGASGWAEVCGED